VTDDRTRLTQKIAARGRESVWNVKVCGSPVAGDIDLILQVSGDEGQLSEVLPLIVSPLLAMTADTNRVARAAVARRCP